MSIIVQNNQLNSNISISESPSIILDTESKGYYISSNLQTPTRDQTLSRSYLLNDVSNQNIKKSTFFRADASIRVICPTNCQKNELSTFNFESHIQNNKEKKKKKCRKHSKFLNVNKVKPKKSRLTDNKFIDNYYLDFLDNLYKNDEPLNNKITANNYNSKDLNQFNTIKFSINNNNNNDVSKNRDDYKENNENIKKLKFRKLKAMPKNRRESFFVKPKFERNFLDDVDINNIDKHIKKHSAKKLHIQPLKKKSSIKENNNINEIKEKEIRNPLTIENVKNESLIVDKDKTKKNKNKKKGLSKCSKNKKKSKLEIDTSSSEKNTKDEKNKKDDKKSVNNMKNWLKTLCCYMGK